MRFILGGPRVFGLRTGVIFGLRDLEKLFGDSETKAPSAPAEPSFIYVIKGEHGRCKVGITSDVNQRLAQLRTGSAFPIEYAWIGVPDGSARLIETDVLNMLDPYRTHLDWFDMKPDAVVGSICAVAHRRGIAMLEVTQERAELLRQIGEAQDRLASMTWQDRVWNAVVRALIIAFKIVAAIVLSVVLVGFVWLAVDALTNAG